MSNPYAPQDGKGWGGYPQGQQGYGPDPYGGQGQQAGYGGYQPGYGQPGGYAPAQYQGEPQAGYPQGQQGYGPDPYGGGQAPGGFPQGYGQPGGFPQGAPPQKGKSKAPLIIGIVAGLVVFAIVVGGVVWAMSGSGSSDPNAGSSPSADSSPGADSSAPANGNGGSSGALHSQQVYGSNVTFDIVSIESGPQDDNKDETIRVVYRVHNNEKETIPTLEYVKPYQNGESLEHASYLFVSAPKDYELVPGLEDVQPGKSGELVAYYKAPKKNTPVEFRDMSWMVLEAKGQKMEYWTWQPK